MKHKPNSLKSKQLQNDAPFIYNDMLSGVFEMAQGYGTQSALTIPWGLAFSDQYNPLTLNRILCSYSYFTHGILQNMVDIPIEDAFRGGFEISCDEFDPEDIELLLDVMDKAGDIKAIKDTMRWRDVFGGSGMIINTDQDPQKELDINLIDSDSPLSFIAADRWELLLNFIQAEDIPCPYNYYGQSLHRSRVIKIMGKEAPSYIRLRLQGWGMSVYERVIREIQQYLKENDLIYEALNKYVIDVYKLKGYNTTLASAMGRKLIDERYRLANMGKNFHKALIMDMEDDYIPKQITLAGLPEIMQQVRIAMSGAVGMPMSKLFGLQPQGFASDEGDIENYNARVESEVRAHAKEILLKVVPLRCKQIFGFIPKHIEYKFKPLRVLGGVEEQNLKLSKFNMYSGMYSQGLFDDMEYAQILNQEKLCPIKTKVEQGIREIEPPEPSASFDIPQTLVTKKVPDEK